MDSWMFVTPLCILSLFTGKNKRVGKQLASQKILQLLHPHVKNWGSLLRMYGRESSKMVKQVTEPLPQPWSPAIMGDGVEHLCSCSWLPLLGCLLGYVCDFLGVGIFPAQRAWAWCGSVGRGLEQQEVQTVSAVSPS